MSESGKRPVWLTPSVAIALFLVSAFSLLGYVALSAYAPDFRDDVDGGSHALSTSAIGFAGIVRLLRYEHVPAVIDRGLPAAERARAALIIVTPSGFVDPSDVAHLSPLAERLIVLPKWIVMPDPTRRGWVRKLDVLDAKDVIDLSLKSIAPKSVITRRKDKGAVSLSVVQDNSLFDVPARIAPVDSLQVLSGTKWIPIITDGKGGALLAQLRGTRTYVLSDPDLMNTQGLRDLQTTRAAEAIIRGLRTGDGAVLFDVTIDGFGRSPSLLRAVFAPPFLGATVCAILVAALMAFHALARFGAPAQVQEALGAGKALLVENSAQLIRMLHREPHMALRYAQTTRDIAGRVLGIPRGSSSEEVAARLERISNVRDDSTGLKELFDDAAGVRTNAGLLDIATRLYAWRRELTHERE
jgi:hypothetical protein